MHSACGCAKARIVRRECRAGLAQRLPSNKPPEHVVQCAACVLGQCLADSSADATALAAAAEQTAEDVAYTATTRLRLRHCRRRPSSAWPGRPSRSGPVSEAVETSCRRCPRSRRARRSRCSISSPKTLSTIFEPSATSTWATATALACSPPSSVGSLLSMGAPKVWDAPTVGESPRRVWCFVTGADTRRPSGRPENQVGRPVITGHPTMCPQ
jgi:hypothetical protein